MESYQMYLIMISYSHLLTRFHVRPLLAAEDEALILELEPRSGEEQPHDLASPLRVEVCQLQMR